VDVDYEEMFVFLAITMLMARNKKLKIQDYWSMDPLSHQPIFGKYMIFSLLKQIQQKERHNIYVYKM
jgi:hypothetical protein